jgi:hypothetical protein
MYPGNSFCMDSLASWGNSYFYGNPSHGACLFYRWFAKPRTSTVYELVGCNTWEFGVYVYVQMDSEIGRTSSIETLLRPARTMKMNNVSISLIGISHPPAPLLNADFLFDGKRMALLREALPEALHCIDRPSAQAFNCTLTPSSCTDCFPDHSKGTVSCECRSLNLEKLMDDPQRSLPIDFFHHQLRHMGRRAFAIAAYSPVQVHLAIRGLRVSLEHHKALCTITPQNLTGCFRCATGARLDYSCRTSFGTATAEIE